MEGIPPSRVDAHVMADVGFQILAAVGLAALVNAPLLGANNEQVILLRIEIEAAATGQSTEGAATGEYFVWQHVMKSCHQIAAVSAITVLAGAAIAGIIVAVVMEVPHVGRTELEGHDGLHLELVLAHVPFGHSAITRDGVEGTFLAKVFLDLPMNLPNRVGVPPGSHRRRVDGLSAALVGHIEHHNAAIVATHGQQRWILRMKVQTHDTRLGPKGVFWIGCVLEREETDQAGRLLREVEGSIPDGE